MMTPWQRYGEHFGIVVVFRGGGNGKVGIWKREETNPPLASAQQVARKREESVLRALQDQ
jgi:hypothetical protein